MRDHWSLDPDLVYLNHGSWGAVPRVTQDAQRRLQSSAEANPMRWFRDLPDRLVRTRERIGGYLGVAADDLALVPNATVGINVALRSLRAGPGQRLILTSQGYAAVLLAVNRVAAERGWTVDVVDVPLEASDAQVLAAIENAVDDSTAAIVVDQITSATAKLLPVESIAELGRRNSVPVIVDGAHAPALLDSPVCGDYWTGNLHKWPCAPRGTGVLYVATERQREVVPHVVSWGDPVGFPQSFDRPGTMDATGWLAAVTSLDLMESLGFAEERKRLGELVTSGAALVAEAIGGTVADVGSPAPTMRIVTLPDGLVTNDVEGTRLGAHLSARSGVETAISTWNGKCFIRLSAHLYTTFDDFSVAARRLAPLFADIGALERAVRG